MNRLQFLPFGRRRRPNVWAGVASGMVGGLVATWAMGQYLALAQRAQKAVQTRRTRTAVNGVQPEDRGLLEDRLEVSEGDQRPATVKTAAAVSERLFRHQLTSREEAIAGSAVHYTFGTLMGGLYGGVAEVQPLVKAGAGLGFGSALFVGADEVAVPLLRLGPPPRHVPLGAHVNYWVAHLIYGATTEGVRSWMRRMF